MSDYESDREDYSDRYEAHEAQERAENRENDLRQKYLGTLGLLAQCSVNLRDTTESTADELCGLIIEALEGAKEHFPTLKWKRILSRIEVDVR